MDSQGAALAWEMGLGKARLAIALAMMGGKRNLICVEPYLVDEMGVELYDIGLSPDDFQFIENESDLQDLKRINVITYNRLRSSLKSNPNKTYASKLRRRIHTLVADEGSLLANEKTLQSQALLQVSAKKKYILDGTPLQNYPRGIRPILNYTAGDSTARMPYGTYGYHNTKSAINSLEYAGRGIDAFKDQFVTLEWCTNQFADELQEGAKREIPKIADLDAYRTLLNNKVKRRVQQEPEVKKFVKIDPPERETVSVEFDHGHLAHYLKVADDFAELFKREKEAANLKGKNLNLVALLARIGAVSMAANQPQRESKLGTYNKITSKQQYLIDKAIEYTDEGHKTIIYVDSPDTVELITREIHKQGYDALAFSGRESIKSRTKKLNEQFRYGDCPILVATIQTTQKGLNLYQADRVLMGCRLWLASKEEQAIYRTCRPQQTRKVLVTYVHLEGSIDEYKAQMVAFKRDAANAGLDYAQPEYDDKEFVHMDTLLGQFCEDLALFAGFQSGHEFKKAVKAA